MKGKIYAHIYVRAGSEISFKALRLVPRDLPTYSTSNFICKAEFCCSELEALSRGMPKISRKGFA